MSKLITNNLSRLNKLSSSDGVISGDKASGRIELELLSNKSLYRYQVPLTINIDDSGFIEIVLLYEGSVVESIFFYESVSNFIINDLGVTIDKIIIKGSRINKISAPVDLYIEIPTPPPVIGSDESPVSTVSLNNVEIKLNCIQFPKDSPEEIDCENIFANWNLQGELPELDDRISNLSGAFANTQITGEIPKLPKNLQSASNAFLNCTGLTGPSKDLIQQFITVNKPYFDLNYENMVSGCEKCVTSWFSTNCGGDHDERDYLVYTSSKNGISTAYPYISLTLPRGLKDNYQFRAVYKSGDRIDTWANFVFCSRDTVGKSGALLSNFSNRIRIDQNSVQHNIFPTSLKQERPCDFCVTTKSVSKVRHLECYSLDFEEKTTTASNTSVQNTNKILTLFVSQTGSVPSNPGKLAIAELDIWDDEGYLIRMRSQGTSMVDLVSGTTYSSASSTPFTTENVEMRDVDKEDLLFWEKFTGKTLTPEFWTEYDIALQDYKENPTKTEQWTVTFDKTTDTFSSNCPYFETAPTKPLVNFFLTRCSGNYPSYNTSTGKHITAKSAFTANTNQLMYFPNLVTGTYIMANQTAQEYFPIVPKSGVGSLAGGWKYKGKHFIYLPNSTNIESAFHSGNATEHYVWAPKSNRLYNLYTYSFGYHGSLKKVEINCGKLNTCTQLNLDYSPVELLVLNGDFSSCTNILRLIEAKGASPKITKIKIQINKIDSRELLFPAVTHAVEFSKNRTGFDQALIVPSLSDGTNMFLNSGLSAYNIQLTLESLPEHTDGNVHTITFTGCPGIVYNETNETFEGMANCPVFLKDNVRQELRKAFVSAINKGWTVEIGTAQNAASAVMTLDLDSEPQVVKYYKITESEDGNFEDSLGKKYILQEGSAFSKEGVNIGYFPFTSKEECLLSWGLTEIVEDFPVLEEVEESQNS